MTKFPITPELWDEIISLYKNNEALSLNTATTMFKRKYPQFYINHQIISKKLKSLGIFRDKNHLSSTRVIDRRKFIAPGRLQNVK